MGFILKNIMGNPLVRWEREKAVRGRYPAPINTKIVILLS